MKYTTVNLDLWKWQGMVLIGGSPDTAKAQIKKWLDADCEIGKASAAHAYCEYGKPWVIWLESLKNMPDLAHEALHITSGVLESRGLKFTEASEEAFTYTMEFIIAQVLKTKRWRVIR